MGVVTITRPIFNHIFGLDEAKNFKNLMCKLMLNSTCMTHYSRSSGINVAGILGDTEADPEGLVGAHRGTGLGSVLCPLPRKKVEFFAWHGVLTNCEWYFLNLGVGQLALVSSPNFRRTRLPWLTTCWYAANKFVSHSWLFDGRLSFLILLIIV